MSVEGFTVMISCKRFAAVIGGGILAIILCASASSQDTAYAFSTKCFGAPTISLGFYPNPTPPGNVLLQLKPDAPADCVKNQVLTDQAVTLTYTTKAIDLKLTDVNGVAANSLKAIKAAIADNSIKADQVDALVASIEAKLYAKVLARVKADLEASSTAPAQKKAASVTVPTQKKAAH